MELAGRWALVTGGARRVGREIALELAARGANVAVHCRRSRADAASVAREIQARGTRSAVLEADLADAKAVARLAAEAENLPGGIAVLVNNAANYLRTPFDALTEEAWDASLATNLKGPCLLSWHLGRAMRRRGEGHIVNITDGMAERPSRDYLAYCVSKAALVALTRGLARELAPDVRVNAVAPGPVLLPEGTSEAERAAVERATPLRRVGRAEDVARAVRFLVTEGDYATGGVLFIDGGRALA